MPYMTQERKKALIKLGTYVEILLPKTNWIFSGSVSLDIFLIRTDCITLMSMKIMWSRLI